MRLGINTLSRGLAAAHYGGRSPRPAIARHSSSSAAAGPRPARGLPSSSAAAAARPARPLSSLVKGVAARPARLLSAAAGPPSDSAPTARLPPRRPCLIFNPIAGQEAAEEMLGRIILRLGATFKDGVTVMLTTKDLHAEQLARTALDHGADLVVASGGDGTIAAVAGALRGSGVPLGIVPRGTANAFSVALGIPTHLESPYSFVEEACDVIVGGQVALVDVALVSTSSVNDAPCILLTGIGLEAEAVEGADRGMKDMLGAAAYLLAGGAALLRGDGGFRAKITVDGEEHEGAVGALTIANAAPPTSVLAHLHVGDCIPDDGLLEVSGFVASGGTLQSVVSVGRLAVGVLLPGVGEGDEGGGALVQDAERIFGGRAKEVCVEADPPQKVVIDGELMGTTPVRARVVPAALQVLVPQPPGAAPATGEAVRGAASEAASALGATTAAGIEASRATEPSFEALDRQP